MEQTRISLREARPDDAAAIAGIFNHYVASSTVIFSNRIRTAAEMEQKIRDCLGRTPFLVAQNDGGRLLGYCYAHPWQPDEVYGRTLEVTIYLAHDTLGQGIGSRLLAELIGRCRALGCHTLLSAVTEGNAPCEALHRKLGFTRVACMKEVGFKFGRYLNDVFYQLILPDENPPAKAF